MTRLVGYPFGESKGFDRSKMTEERTEKTKEI